MKFPSLTPHLIAGFNIYSLSSAYSGANNHSSLPSNSVIAFLRLPETGFAKVPILFLKSQIEPTLIERAVSTKAFLNDSSL